MPAVKAGEDYRLEQEIWFDGHRYGSTFNSFPHGGEVQIRRGADGFYWDGAAFVSGVTWLASTFDGTDATDPHHYYSFTFPVGAADGDTFTVRMRVVGDKYTDRVYDFIVREDGGATMIAHDHTGAYAWDLPIGDRGD